MFLNLTYVLIKNYQGLFYPIGLKKILSPEKLRDVLQERKDASFKQVYEQFWMTL